MAKICVHAFVSGKVQRVAFRHSTRKTALGLDLAGWAKNLEDGRVEVMLCGEEESVNRALQWLHKGPALAKVTGVESCIEEWFEYSRFAIS
jgi:acylphosphatase